MPIPLHLTLLIGGQIAGGFLLPLTALMARKKLQAMGLNFVLVAFVAFVLGYFVPRLICGVPAPSGGI